MRLSWRALTVLAWINRTRDSTQINAGKKEHTARASAYHEADASQLIDEPIESDHKTSTVSLGRVRSPSQAGQLW